MLVCKEAMKIFLHRLTTEHRNVSLHAGEEKVPQYWDNIQEKFEKYSSLMNTENKEMQKALVV